MVFKLRSAAPACAEATALLRLSMAPGGEVSMAREEHKLATLRFHAAIQHGPGPGGEEAVGLAAAQVQRALSAVTETLGLADPAALELAKMASALLNRPNSAPPINEAPEVDGKGKNHKGGKKKKKAVSSTAQLPQPQQQKDRPASGSGSKKQAGSGAGVGGGGGRPASAPTTAAKKGSPPRLRVRSDTIGHARIQIVGKSQSCMVSKL